LKLLRSLCLHIKQSPVSRAQTQLHTQ
jgi:hypothetical protein